MEKIKKMNKMEIILSVMIFQLPFIMMDSFGVVYFISALAILGLIYPEYERKYNETGNQNKNIIWLAFGILLIGMITFLISFKEIRFPIIVNKIILFPSAFILFYYLIPIIWAISDTKILKSFIMVNKKVVKLICFMVIPFVVIALYQLLLEYKYYSELPNHQVIQNIFQFIFGAAIGEELLFRGFFYNLIKKITKNVYVSSIISSLLFALIHLNLILPLIRSFNYFQVLNLIVVFMLGISSSIIYEKSESLFPSIVFHACFNGTIIYIMIFFKNVILV